MVPAVAAAAFPDVDAGHPYKTAIDDLAARTIINGFTDGTYGPDYPVTRQQFAKMITRSMRYPVSESDKCPFDDVSSNLSPTDPLYPDHYVAVCAAKGITVGTTATTFSPYANITRAQLITMVGRAGLLPEVPLGYDPGFPDFSADHYPWAAKAAHAGLLAGLLGLNPYQTGYDFWKPATRGECAQLLYNLIGRALVTPGSITNPYWAVTNGMPAWRFDSRVGEPTVELPEGTTLIFRAAVRNQLGDVMTSTDVSASFPKLIGIFTGGLMPVAAAVMSFDPDSYVTDYAGFLFWTSGGLGYFPGTSDGDRVGASFWLDFNDNDQIDPGAETASNVPGWGTPWAEWEFVAAGS